MQRVIWQLVLSHKLGHRHSRTKARETNFHELLRIEGAMIVAAPSDGLGQHDARGVHCLPNVFKIHSTSNFFDEDGSQALVSKLLVNTQKVDFRHGHGVVMHTDVRRNSGNECKKLPIGCIPDAHMPVLVVAWWG